MFQAVIAVVLVFAVIVMIHELGHFLFARLFDIQVDEFCIGMGPKIWGIKRGETYYGVCLFPIGGYVKVAGMDLATGDDSDPMWESERGFNKQSVWRRICVIAGGPLFNFGLAVLLVMLLGPRRQALGRSI